MQNCRTEGERERQRDGERQRERERDRQTERERERERERDCVRQRGGVCDRDCLSLHECDPTNTDTNAYQKKGNSHSV